MNLDDLRDTFFEECEELLEGLADGLNEIEAGSSDEETLNAIFRAVHSIKGGAGAFGLQDLVRFAHRFETTLDLVRSGTLEMSDAFLQTAFRSSDVLSDLVNAARDGTEMDPEPIDKLMAEFEAFASDAPEEEKTDFQPMGLDFDFGPAVETDGYKITFTAHGGLYLRGGETSRLFRALADLGTLVVTCQTENVLSLDELDLEHPCLAWELVLEGDAPRADVEEVFEFVEEDCDCEIDEITSEEEGPVAIDLGDLGGEEEARPFEDPPKEAPPPQEVKAADKPEPNKQKSEGPRATVRIDLMRVERLINLVGELVINQAVLSQKVFDADIAPSSEISTGLDEFRQLTRDIQDSVMAIRAQPVKPLFQRMSRIVREGAAATGKQVHLQTEGDWVEIDKTVIERLSDPLTHMIRNAVDHGLESTDKRIEAGKSEVGEVRLSAAHRSGRVVIEVGDDGGGINRERVLSSAIEKGLVPEGVSLSDQEIDGLLFMPGFSTAKEISDLSGRGVGMDVVKKAIQALGGRIGITSVPGEGTTFSISLPLTMAVLDGIVVQIADQTVVLPLNNVVETLKPQADALHSLGTGTVIMVREEFVPIVDLGSRLGFRPQLEKFDDQVVLLCESDDGDRGALIVDAIHDQRQVVIKGLQENYGEVDGVAAATILGDGRIALILDVAHCIAPKGALHLPDAAAAEQPLALME